MWLQETGGIRCMINSKHRLITFIFLRHARPYNFIRKAVWPCPNLQPPSQNSTDFWLKRNANIHTYIHMLYTYGKYTHHIFKHVYRNIIHTFNTHLIIWVLIRAPCNKILCIPSLNENFHCHNHRVPAKVIWLNTLQKENQIDLCCCNSKLC